MPANSALEPAAAAEAKTHRVEETPAAGAMPHGPRAACFLIHLMFLTSGVASLMCEVVWFKQLQFVLGSSTFAVSVVVACFFGGLAVGSWLAGRWADRSMHPLRLYALLELSLALISALVTLVLSRWQTWIEWLAPWLGPDSQAATPVMLLCSLAILIAPTALMGATLPVLSRYLVRERQQLAQRIGVLYGLNTLGAATGCALVGFVLIGWLGVIETALLASALYLIIATVAGGLTVHERGMLRESSQRPQPPPTPGSPEPLGMTVASARVLILVFGLMGFASIAYEVLWFRILACFGIHSVYAFAGMLSVYLLGLVLGSFICARFLAPHKERHVVYFARIQLLIAAAGLVSLALLGRSRNLLESIIHVEQHLGLHYALAESLAGISPVLWLTLIVLLLPTTLIGIGFPLAVELTVHRMAVLGSRLGTLYSLNTLGGVFGSLLTGFVLLPLLGSLWSFLTMVLLNLFLFGMIVASQSSLRRSRGLWREGVLTAAGLLICFIALGRNYLQDAQTKYEGAQALAFRESTDATFVVLGYAAPHTGPYQQLMINGKSYANNSPPGRRYMGTLGHLPALLHPQPKDALVICIGTGTTVGSLTLQPTIEHVTAVDLCRDVFDVAPYFVPLNNRFNESPKVRSVVADGRHFLLTNPQQYDVLTFEPPPPSDAGVVNLYSREFYQLAKRRMRPGAVLCQWMPLDMDQEILPRMMLQTLRTEFPHVSLWIPSRMEGVAIASMQPLQIDEERLRLRQADPGVRADLAAIGLADPEQLLATFLCADADLAGFVADAPLVTDNRPRIEYFNFYPSKIARFDDVLPYRQRIERYLTCPPTNPAALEQQRQVITHFWFNHDCLAENRLPEALRHAQAALRLDPSNRYAQYLLGEVEDRSRQR